MTRAEYTTSPWQTDRTGFHVIKQEKDGVFTIAILQPMAEIRANARLIAAAPELLEACEMQQKLIDDMVRFVGQMALQDYALLNEAPIKARAAIAKARGE